MSEKMVNRKSWEEFKDSKMLWLANRTLQIFGWSIIFETGKDREVVDVFPARVKFRGFDEKTNSEGFIGISKYMKDNAKTLKKESEL